MWRCAANPSRIWCATTCEPSGSGQESASFRALSSVSVSPTRSFRYQVGSDGQRDYVTGLEALALQLRVRHGEDDVAVLVDGADRGGNQKNGDSKGKHGMFLHRTTGQRNYSSKVSSRAILNGLSALTECLPFLAKRNCSPALIGYSFPS